MSTLVVGRDLLERALAGEREAVEALREELHSTGLSTERSRAKRRRTKAEKLELKLTVREAVEKRANGKCENCGRPFGRFDRAEFDHFWLRAKAPETTATCWLLCRSCHRQKHAEEPSRIYWVECYLVHLERHPHADGVPEQITAAKHEVSWLRLKKSWGKGRRR